MAALSSHFCSTSSPARRLDHQPPSSQPITSVHTHLPCHPSPKHTQARLCQAFSSQAERPSVTCLVSPVHKELATSVCQVSTQAEQPTAFHHISCPQTELESTLGGISSSKTELPHGLDARRLPRHVAIIMDGNSRWAESRGLPRTAGHEAGLTSLRRVVDLSVKWGIHALTVFAFSTENWHRSQVEVSFLMELFQLALEKEFENFVKGNIQVRVIGDLKCFPARLQSLMQEVERKTAHNTGLKYTIAASYGGRYDIVRACQQIAANVQQGKLNPVDITEAHVGKELGTSWMEDTGDPDLLIRTGGERRLSNFLLWQLAYTELLFLDEMWPDITDAHYADALLYYQRRNRRFGVRSRDSTS